MAPRVPIWGPRLRVILGARAPIPPKLGTADHKENRSCSGMLPLPSPIETVDCTDARDFCNAIAPFGRIFDGLSSREPFLYRGHGRARFDLKPSAFRPEDRERLRQYSQYDLPDSRSEVAQWFLEATSLQHFLKRADEAGLHCPEDSQYTRAELRGCINLYSQWLMANDEHGGGACYYWTPDGVLLKLLSMLAIAQHHGIPTRLLDWSRSSFVAAYFAAADALKFDGDEPLSVHALDTGAARIHTNHQFGIVTVPRAANPNLHAQEGVHSYFAPKSCMPSDPATYLCLDEELSKTRTERTALYKITLAKAHAAELLWILDRMGYNSARLFPGFDGAARAVMQFRLMRSPAK